MRESEITWRAKRITEARILSLLVSFFLTPILKRSQFFFCKKPVHIFELIKRQWDLRLPGGPLRIQKWPSWCIFVRPPSSVSIAKDLRMFKSDHVYHPSDSALFLVAGWPSYMPFCPPRLQISALHVSSIKDMKKSVSTYPLKLESDVAMLK